MSDNFKIVNGAIGALVNPGGSFTIPYPAGTDANTFYADGHTFIVNNQRVYTDPAQAGIAFGDTVITITNNTTLSWVNGDAYEIQLNSWPIDEFTGDVVVGRNLTVNGRNLFPGPNFPVKANTEQAIRDAYTLAGAAGGGTILLPSARIVLTSPLSAASNIRYFGVAPKMIYPDGVDGGLVAPASGDGVGTVLVGDGTFNGIEFHATDDLATVYTTYPNDFYSAGIQNFGVENIAFVNFKNAIALGAKNSEGANYSRFRNLYACQCAEWGFRFDNFIHNIFEGINSYGCLIGGQRYWMSIPDSASGNSYFNSLLNTAPTTPAKSCRKSQGISFIASNGASWGTLTGFYLQSNKFNDAPLGGGSLPLGTGVSGTTTGGSASIGVPDGTEFAVGMPVSTKAGADASFTANTIYIVAAVSGNTIKLANLMGGAPILATGSGGLTICTSGFSPFVLAGVDSTDTAEAQTPASNVVTFAGTGYNPDFVSGQQCVVTTTGTCPGLTPGSTYYLIRTGSNQFKFATSRANAAAGTAITLSSAWTGTATITTGGHIMASGDLVGLDIEAGGTAACYLQNANDVNISANSVGASGATGPADFVHLFCGRGAANCGFSSLRPYSSDFDSSFNHFSGNRNTDSVGYTGVGVWRTNVLGAENGITNINLAATWSDLTKLTMQIAAIGGGSQATRMGFPILDNCTVTANGSTFPTGSSGTVVYNGSGDAAWSMPSVADTAVNSTQLGLHYAICNITGNKIVLTATGGQKFNDTLSTFTIGAYQSAVFTSAVKTAGSEYIWAVVGNNFKYTKQVSYSSTRTLDFGISTMQEIGALTGDITLAFSNVPAAGTAITVTLYTDSFASGTRNITWPGNARFNSTYAPFTQPIVITNANATTTIQFVVGRSGNLIALNPNVWY